MTGEVPPSPLGMMRHAVSQWEKTVNQLGTQWLESPEAARVMQTWVGLALWFDAASTEASAKLLAAANMPSRADVTALGERLVAIEMAIARIEAQLRPDNPQPRRAVRRTRKPKD